MLAQRRAGAAARRRGAARKAERAAMEDMAASVWVGVDGVAERVRGGLAGLTTKLGTVVRAKLRAAKTGLAPTGSPGARRQPAH